MSLVDLVLTITYAPEKAFELSSDGAVVAILKRDLTQLGLSHPKKENVYKTRKDRVSCCWPNLGTRHSILRSMAQKVEFVESGLKSCLCIVDIKCYEAPSGEWARYRAREKSASSRRESRSASSRRSVRTSANRDPSPSQSIIARRALDEEEPVRRSSRIKQNEHMKNLEESLAALRRLGATLPETHPQAVGQAPSSAIPSPPNQPPPPVPPPDAETVVNPPSQSDIERVTREFWAARRLVTVGKAQSTVLLEELHRMGAPKLPKMQSATEPLDVNDIAAIEATLREEIRLRKQLETRLLEEQARRADAERALQDVERECKAPFIVPALMQAFLDISKLSDQSITKPSL